MKVGAAKVLAQLVMVEFRVSSVEAGASEEQEAGGEMNVPPDTERDAT